MSYFIYFRHMILVTGGTGLIGSHLLFHLLKEHDKVKAIHRKSSNLEAVKRVFSYYDSDFKSLYDRIIWVESSLEDITGLEKAFKSVTEVYHCAALISFDPAEYQKMRRINIDGTSNIVNFCISNSVKKLCFVSSIAAIEKNGDKIIDELNQWNKFKTKSNYAITKYGGEMEAWRGSQEGVDVIIVNPGIVLGSGFWDQGSGKIFSKIYKGLQFYTKGITGFVGVNDVVRIMIKLMESDIKNERYILVSENVSFKNIFCQIAEGLNKPRPRFHMIPVLTETIWRLDTLVSKIFRRTPSLTRNSAKSAQAKYFFSSKKVENAISYKFESIEESIRTTCKIFLSTN